MTIAIDTHTEWLETDGLGGFASGTTRGIRTRRYHGLLLSAATPPTNRFMLVNGLDVWIKTPDGEFPLALHEYTPGVTNDPRGLEIEQFDNDPWPTWTLRLVGGVRIAHSICMTRGAPRAVVTWKILDPRPGIRLSARPLFSGRDYHSLHHENSQFAFEPRQHGASLRWSPYLGVPEISAAHNGTYRHEPVWYRGFQYAMERERGEAFVEDLASPGVIDFDLSSGEARLVLAAVCPVGGATPEECAPDVDELLAIERERRRHLETPLERAADSYLVKRGSGTTIIAGYPWFSDWGRDTFIAIRGLCLATGRLDDARSILLAWADTDSRGVLPNRFPDQGDTPEYNSVDAGLWYIIASDELMRRARDEGRPLSPQDTGTLRAAILRIISGYAGGTHHGIKMDKDGLLAAGEPGVQLTWMDARVGDRVITPRIGKPVEIQALWLNSLRIASQWEQRWSEALEKGRAAFDRKFWNEDEGCLFDVIDADHVAGKDDPSVRPNQILAVGGLPLCLLSDDRAKRVVDRVEAQLLTPLGLRSLAPTHPDYAPRYRGGPAARDAVYHQGTVWPWLLGAFVEAWLRVRGASASLRAEARSKFLAPMMAHIDSAGVGHVSEIADAEPPHAPNGCPFQAWSTGELLRLERRVLAEDTTAKAAATRDEVKTTPRRRATPNATAAASADKP